ncbi:MAG: DUF3280 domain-containing protein [Filomicrobium sp.]
MKIKNLILLSSFLAVMGFSTYAAATPRAAVLPFEIHIDLQMDGLSLYGLPPEPKPAEKKRLEMARDRLISMLEERGVYQSIDLSDFKKEIRKAAPFDRCNGCEVEFGKKADADVTILGVVNKSSEMMINIAVFVRDVASGELTQSMSVSILQNDDAGWLRAIRYLVNNRLAPVKAESK